MKTPRLALLALWALLAPSFAAAADPGWLPEVQSGTEWTSVKFEIDSGKTATYWFRSNEMKPATPLYALDLVKQEPNNQTVIGSALFSSAVTAYTIKTAYGPDRYTVTRVGNPKWTRRGSISGTKGAATIVVTSPGATPEKADPSPLTVYKPNLASIKWEDYYYTRVPRKSEYWGLKDPDGDYRDAKKSYAAVHLRVLPFEYMFNSDKCFAAPETCTKAKDANAPAFLKAAYEASKGNLLQLNPLAIANHKEYAEAAKKFKNDLDAAPADKFSDPEAGLLHRLLVENKMLPAFQAEQSKHSGQPATLQQFVKKWRTYLKEEIDAYLKDSEAAGAGEINHTAKLKAMNERITKAAAVTVGAGKPVKDPATGKPAKDPVTGKPAKDPATGKPVVAAPKHDLKINAEDKLWRDTITPIGSWRAIKAGTPIPGAAADATFYCYHVKMVPTETITKHLKAPANKKVMVECVDWSVASKEDAPQVEPKTNRKFKVRNAKVQVYLAFVGGKLTLVNEDGSVAGIGGILTEAKRPAAADVAEYVKVTLKQTPAVAASIPLAAIETRWLTKNQRDDYTSAREKTKDEAALKQLDAAARLNVEKNIRPEFVAAYRAAYGKSAEEIEKAIGKAEMWGGDETKVTVIVEPFQEKPDAKMLEIQLSKADWEALKPNPKEKDKAKEAKKAAALKQYKADRGGADGALDGKFNKDYYDPVTLHQITLEVLDKGLGKTPPKDEPKPNGDGEFAPRLSEAELLLLTDKERTEYIKSYREPADKKVPGAEKLLSEQSARLRKLTDQRAKDPVYAEPKDLAEFKLLKDWQQRKFCATYPVDIAIIEKDATAAPLDTETRDAKVGLGNSQANPVTKAKSTPADASAKKPNKELQEACRKLAPEVASEINPNPKPKEEGAIGGKVNVANGVDKDKPDEKKPNPWLAAPLITAAARGSLVGLVIGSLFGPIGLIAGPLIGAALAYGITKHASDKAKKDE